MARTHFRYPFSKTEISVQVTALRKPKFVIMGYHNHGKAEVSEYLSKYGLKSLNGSFILCEDLIYPVLKDKARYRTFIDCWIDRKNRKFEWMRLIEGFNKVHPYRTAELIFKHAEIYEDLRDLHEFKVIKARKMFDYSIWVNGFPREKTIDKPCEITVNPGCVDFIIDNSKPGLENLHREIDQLMKTLDLKKLK